MSSQLVGRGVEQWPPERPPARRPSRSRCGTVWGPSPAAGGECGAAPPRGSRPGRPISAGRRAAGAPPAARPALAQDSSGGPMERRPSPVRQGGGAARLGHGRMLRARRGLPPGRATSPTRQRRPRRPAAHSAGDAAARPSAAAATSVVQHLRTRRPPSHHPAPRGALPGLQGVGSSRAGRSLAHPAFPLDMRVAGRPDS